MADGYNQKLARAFTPDDAAQISAWARANPLGQLSRGAAMVTKLVDAELSITAGTPRVAGDLSTYFGDSLCAALLQDAAGNCVGLTLAAEAAETLIERTLGAPTAKDTEQWPQLGPLGELERGVLGYTIARWLAAGAEMSPPATIHRLRAMLTRPHALAEALGPAPLLRWPFSLQIGSLCSEGELWLPDRSRSFSPMGTGTRATPKDSDLPLTMTIAVGRATLSAEAIGALEVGDVVLPEHLSLTMGGDGLGDAELCILGGSERLEVGLKAHRLTSELCLEVTQPLPREKWPSEKWPSEQWTPALGSEKSGSTVKGKDSETPEEPIGSEARASAMPALPVQLSLELGRFSLPYSALGQLSLGEVIKTGLPSDRHVGLWAGNQQVAEGELVEIGGELGIQIRRLLR